MVSEDNTAVLFLVVWTVLASCALAIVVFSALPYWALSSIAERKHNHRIARRYRERSTEMLKVAAVVLTAPFSVVFLLCMWFAKTAREIPDLRR